MFHQLVDMMFYGLMKGEFSLYELRDACTLAINKYAEHIPPDPVLIKKEFFTKLRKALDTRLYKT